jgi:hypothetical protein
MFAAQKSDLKEWLERGAADGATHMIVVVDGWDHEDYPVYVMPGENVREVADKYDGKEMQRIMEVYDLSKDHQLQLNEHRAFNF